MLLIRYSTSNLSALCVAYILLTGAQSTSLSNFELQIPRKPHATNAREVSSKTVRSLSIGCMALGFTIILGTQYKTAGLLICTLAGLISIIASFGEMFGYWEWTEDRLQKETKEDMKRMERVMGVLRVPGRSDEVFRMAKQEGEIRLETACGILVTRRLDAGNGFTVILEKAKEDVIKADLIWDINLKGDQEWVDTARNVVVGEQWEYLLSLYP